MHRKRANETERWCEKRVRAPSFVFVRACCLYLQVSCSPTSLYIASVFIKLSLTTSSCSPSLSRSSEQRAMWNALHLFQVVWRTEKIKKKMKTTCIKNIYTTQNTYVWHISIVHSMKLFFTSLKTPLLDSQFFLHFSKFISLFPAVAH